MAHLPLVAEARTRCGNEEDRCLAAADGLIDRLNDEGRSAIEAPDIAPYVVLVNLHTALGHVEYDQCLSRCERKIVPLLCCQSGYEKAFRYFHTVGGNAENFRIWILGGIKALIF